MLRKQQNKSNQYQKSCWVYISWNRTRPFLSPTSNTRSAHMVSYDRHTADTVQERIIHGPVRLFTVLHGCVRSYTASLYIICVYKARVRSYALEHNYCHTQLLDPPEYWGWHPLPLAYCVPPNFGLAYCVPPCFGLAYCVPFNNKNNHVWLFYLHKEDKMTVYNMQLCRAVVGGTAGSAMAVPIFRPIMMFKITVRFGGI